MNKLGNMQKLAFVTGGSGFVGARHGLGCHFLILQRFDLLYVNRLLGGIEFPGDHHVGRWELLHRLGIVDNPDRAVYIRDEHSSLWFPLRMPH